MSVKATEDVMSTLRAILKDDTSDEAISLVEDVYDTLNDLTEKAAGDGVDWKSKYEENDRSWREKYRDRFFNPAEVPEETVILEDEETVEVNTKFDDLFTED